MKSGPGNWILSDEDSDPEYGREKRLGGPERSLLMAIVYRAVKDYLSTERSSIVNRENIRDAEQWLFWEASDREFSLSWISEILSDGPGLADRVRSYCKEIKPLESSAGEAGGREADLETENYQLELILEYHLKLWK